MSEEVIFDAIKNRRVVSGKYGTALRTFEPHLLGYDSEGNLAVSVWELSGDRPGWRSYYFSRLSALASNGSVFIRPRRGYDRNDPYFVRILG